MKTFKTLFIAIAILASYSINAQVAVTTDGSSADGSAMLDVKSTDKGFLPPRLNTAQRDAIGSPVEGLTIYNTDKNCLEFYTGSYWRNLCTVIGPNDVLNPATGKIWMDRNLGATQVATSSTDADAYGDLYQWGRAADGHQGRESQLTTVLATTEEPNKGNVWDGKFITTVWDYPNWLTPANNNLWQGVSGTNNPCPSGYRLPTEAEWDAERLSWSSNNAAGAFASPLKLPVAGGRFFLDGVLTVVGSEGYYWSSTVNGTVSWNLFFFSVNAYMKSNFRANGLSVRCLKD